MKRIKTGVFFLVAMIFANSVIAQSLTEGKDFMYYERYQSAKNVFQKLVAANPSDEEAIYWLGQAQIGLEDVAGAKKLYLDKLAAVPNSPMILAGVGSVELIENKTADARQHFETAISLSQGKSIPVLNAVGFANGNPDSKNGDANYAIDKLKQATQVKKFKDPEVLANLGDAYRKLADGGNAIKSYNAALAINPNYARAIYRSGRVYQTQGRGQESLYLPLYDEAIAKDAKYAPVYNTLFNYYYETDVPKSAQYLDKYLSNSDDDPKACSYRASMKYAQGLFAEAVTMADQCISAEAANPYAKLYQLKAFAYNRLGDSTNAKTNFEEYFKRQDPNKIEGGDYSAYAALLLKFPGNEARVGELIEKAVSMDTLEANKVSYLKSLASAYEGQKDSKNAAAWYAKIIPIKKNYTNVDLFNAGYNYYAVNEYDSSNKYFTLYTTKYPEDILGYYMLGNAAAAADSTGALGTAVPFYQKVIELGEADPTKAQAKTRLMNAYKFFVGYYYNTKKDQPTALTYVDKALALDPADASMISNKEFISKNDPNAPPKKAAAPAKPKTTPKK